MRTQKNLLLVLGEWWEAHAIEAQPHPRRALTWLGRQLMPNLGSVLLVLILLSVFPGLAAPLTGINVTSISTIPYQGRLADASGNPVTGKQNMEFRIYDVPADGTPLWEEFWTGANSVDVSDGLFSVMLGSINTGLTAVVQGNNNLYLGITVGTDSEMEPRVQLGSVPFSIWSLTVADNSISSAKIVDGAVTSAKMNASSGWSYIESLGSTTSQIPTDIGVSHSITFTLEIGQWVDISYGSTCYSESGMAYMGLSFNGEPVNLTTMIENGSNHYLTITGFQRQWLPAGTHTITAKYWTNVGPAHFWRSRLLAVAVAQ